jgi:preprotein translocase subunit SecG
LWSCFRRARAAGWASLGGGGGTETFVGGRQAATFLTRSTWWLGGAFLFLALLLTVVSSRRAVGTTDVQELLRQSQTQSEAPIAPAPLGGTPVQTDPAAGGESNPTAPATPQPAAPQPQPQQ